MDGHIMQMFNRGSDMQRSTVKNSDKLDSNPPRKRDQFLGLYRSVGIRAVAAALAVSSRSQIASPGRKFAVAHMPGNRWLPKGM